MKNILTIDFDILMGKSLNLYNHMSNISWEDRVNQYPLLKEISIDSALYQKITQFLMFLFTKIKKENIHFLEQHHHILKFLTENEYNIINIDHHHDWAYKDSDFDNLIQDFNCGNWVKALSEKKQLSSYVWIKNYLSENPKQDFPHSEFIIENCQLLNFSNVDEIYIIFSPEFVPPHHQNLFFLWMDIANIIYQTHFEIEF